MNRTRSGQPMKPWVHPPESLLRGQVIYNVKFLGHVEVDQPKGSEMVRDAIRKMKFNRQIKKAEGQKPLKVELLLSIDAIKIQEPKMKVIQFQYPLHHVSYCADDKSDKRMFTFIAKEKGSNKHHCFVFDSEKSAEEITLTVGQAFELAYRRFLDSSSKDIDSKKQLLVLQKKVQELTTENQALKQRVVVLEKLVESKSTEHREEEKFGKKFESSPSVVSRTSPVIVQNGINRPVASPASAQTTLPILSPPPPIPSRSFSNAGQNQLSVSNPTQPVFSPGQSVSNPGLDIFGAQPFNHSFSSDQPTFQSPGSASASAASDVFGMNVFNPSTAVLSSFDIDQQIQRMDSELLDLQTNFSRGLSFGTEDFSLDDLDPLKK